METTRRSGVVILLVISGFLLVGIIYYVPAATDYSDYFTALVQSQNQVLDCNGRSSICVAPLSYKTCHNQNGRMVTDNEPAKTCRDGTRCDNEGIDSCVPLKNPSTEETEKAFAAGLSGTEHNGETSTSSNNFETGNTQPSNKSVNSAYNADTDNNNPEVEKTSPTSEYFESEGNVNETSTEPQEVSTVSTFFTEESNLVETEGTTEVSNKQSELTPPSEEETTDGTALVTDDAANQESTTTEEATTVELSTVTEMSAVASTNEISTESSTAFPAEETTLSVISESQATLNVTEPNYTESTEPDTTVDGELTQSTYPFNNETSTSPLTSTNENIVDPITNATVETEDLKENQATTQSTVSTASTPLNDSDSLTETVIEATNETPPVIQSNPTANGDAEEDLSNASSIGTTTQPTSSTVHISEKPNNVSTQAKEEPLTENVVAPDAEIETSTSAVNSSSEQGVTEVSSEIPTVGEIDAASTSGTLNQSTADPAETQPPIEEVIPVESIEKLNATSASTAEKNGEIPVEKESPALGPTNEILSHSESENTSDIHKLGSPSEAGISTQGEKIPQDPEADNGTSNTLVGDTEMSQIATDPNQIPEMGTTSSGTSAETPAAQVTNSKEPAAVHETSASDSPAEDTPSAASDKSEVSAAEASGVETSVVDISAPKTPDMVSSAAHIPTNETIADTSASNTVAESVTDQESPINSSDTQYSNDLSSQNPPIQDPAIQTDVPQPPANTSLSSHTTIRKESSDQSPGVLAPGALAGSNTQTPDGVLVSSGTKSQTIDDGPETIPNKVEDDKKTAGSKISTPEDSSAQMPGNHSPVGQSPSVQDVAGSNTQTSDGVLVGSVAETQTIRDKPAAIPKEIMEDAKTSIPEDSSAQLHGNNAPSGQSTTVQNTAGSNTQTSDGALVSSAAQTQPTGPETIPNKVREDGKSEGSQTSIPNDSSVQFPSAQSPAVQDAAGSNIETSDGVLVGSGAETQTIRGRPEAIPNEVTEDGKTEGSQTSIPAGQSPSIQDLAGSNTQTSDGVLVGSVAETQTISDTPAAIPIEIMQNGKISIPEDSSAQLHGNNAPLGQSPAVQNAAGSNTQTSDGVLVSSGAQTQTISARPETIPNKVTEDGRPEGSQTSIPKDSSVQFPSDQSPAVQDSAGSNIETSDGVLVGSGVETQTINARPEAIPNKVTEDGKTEGSQTSIPKDAVVQFPGDHASAGQAPAASSNTQISDGTSVTINKEDNATAASESSHLNGTSLSENIAGEPPATVQGISSSENIPQRPKPSFVSPSITIPSNVPEQADNELATEALSSYATNAQESKIPLEPPAEAALSGSSILGTASSSQDVAQRPKPSFVSPNIAKPQPDQGQFGEKLGTSSNLPVRPVDQTSSQGTGTSEVHVPSITSDISQGENQVSSSSGSQLPGSPVASAPGISVGRPPKHSIHAKSSYETSEESSESIESIELASEELSSNETSFNKSISASSISANEDNTSSETDESSESNSSAKSREDRSSDNSDESSESDKSQNSNESNSDESGKSKERESKSTEGHESSEDSESSESDESKQSDKFKALDENLTVSRYLRISEENKSKEKTKFECTEDGHFPDPHNCKKYYICSFNEKGKLKKYHLKCHKHQIYDEEMVLCAYKHNKCN